MRTPQHQRRRSAFAPRRDEGPACASVDGPGRFGDRRLSGGALRRSPTNGSAAATSALSRATQHLSRVTDEWADATGHPSRATARPSRPTTHSSRATEQPADATTRLAVPPSGPDARAARGRSGASQTHLSLASLRPFAESGLTRAAAHGRSIHAR